MYRICLLCLVAVLVVSACGGREEAPAPSDDPEVVIPFRRDGSLTFLREGEPLLDIAIEIEPLLDIAIEIADTDSARTRGMMQRESFPDDRSGMLFLFERPAVQSFWMANTPVALDLFYIDVDSQIVDIHRYARPFSPDPIVSSAPAQYVLEVPAGFADRHGITETDRVRWSRGVAGPAD